MEPVELQISYRDNLGSSASRSHRRNGMLPAVVYKPGNPSSDILLNRHDFMLAAKGKAPTQVFLLKGDKGEALTLVKSVQTEPIKGELLHVEFLELFEGNNVVVDVPVRLVGTPACVKLNTAMINQTAYDVRVECLPRSIPDEIVHDISKMKAGDSIEANQLDFPDGVTLRSNAGLTIVSALINRRASETDEAEEEGSEDSEESSEDSGEQSASSDSDKKDES